MLRNSSSPLPGVPLPPPHPLAPAPPLAALGICLRPGHGSAQSVRVQQEAAPEGESGSNAVKGEQERFGEGFSFSLPKQLSPAPHTQGTKVEAGNAATLPATKSPYQVIISC